MLLQVTAGQGPAECRIAVRLLCASLCREFAGTRVLDVHADYASALIEGPDGLAELCGTVGWVCKSPLRPHHKRKNGSLRSRALRSRACRHNRKRSPLPRRPGSADPQQSALSLRARRRRRSRLQGRAAGGNDRLPGSRL